MAATRKTVEIGIEDKKRKIVIFTDSLPACKILRNPKANYHAALIHKLIDNADIEKVEIIWTSSHKGIWFNKIADEIAKLATDVEAPLKLELSKNEVLRLIKGRLESEWNNEYEEISRNKGKFLLRYTLKFQLNHGSGIRNVIYHLGKSK